MVHEFLAGSGNSVGRSGEFWIQRDRRPRDFLKATLAANDLRAGLLLASNVSIGWLTVWPPISMPS